MTAPRLRSDFWIAALRRRAEAAGAFISIARRGAEEAGAIFVLVDRLDRSLHRPLTIVLPDRQIGRKYGNDMAEILPFATSGSNRPRERQHGSGEIVIFPGVRVEYHDRPPSPPAKPRHRRLKRNSASDAL